MPTVAARIDRLLNKRLNQYCSRNNINVTNFLREAITEKLTGDALSLNTDWKVDAANLLGITVGQLQYAIVNGKSATEVIARLNDKSDTIEMAPLSIENTFGVQFTRKDQTDVATIKTTGSKIEMVKNILMKIEDKLLEEMDDYEF